jgi:hypothetical protein
MAKHEMHGSKSEEAAAEGIHAVRLAFTRIGWGTVTNTLHDLGSDLFLLARDAQRVELGLIVGAQVKAGASYFAHPESSDDRQAGWWYYEPDRKHFDMWASYGVPHLLVLHDLDLSKSYWVHVTPESIISTGSGAKVHVPAANTVDVDHLGELLDVAASRLASGRWEGSAWTGGPSLLPKDLLRHALIAPRLVAPHPNAPSSEPLTPEQATALVTQCRLRQLRDLINKQPDIPDLSIAAESPLWPWRFVGTFARWVTTGDRAGLLATITDAPEAHSYAAATVCAAHALISEGLADDALVLLEPALTCQDIGTVDRAWLSVQQARASVEVGHVAEARVQAAQLQAIRSTAPNDVTASAIAGSAALLLFNSSGWDSVNIGGTVQGSDTTASWWRAQTTAGGLEAIAEREFKSWSRDTSVTVGGEDTANNQLLAASLSAGHAGDHGGWRRLMGLLGRDALMRLDRHADPGRLREGIAALRVAGDENAMKLAVRRLVADGPASSVRLAATDIDLNRLTRTTARAVLALLEHGGDVLDDSTRSTAIDWVLSTLDSPSSFEARTSPSYLLEVRLVEVLAGLTPGASATDHHKIIARLAREGALDQLLAHAWARVIDKLPDDAWDEETARTLAESSDGHHQELRIPLLGIYARYDRATRELLIADAREGSLGALAALGNVTRLARQVASDIIASLGSRVETISRNARQGSYGFGGHDIPQALALLNVWHPDVANWEPLLTLLDDDAVSPSDKRSALEMLAGFVDRLDDEILGLLEPVAVKAAQQASSAPADLFGSPTDAIGAGALLAAALGALQPTDAAERLVTLIGGSVDERRWGAQVAYRLRRPEDIGALATLAQDSDVSVRATAASALAHLVASDGGTPLAIVVLERCANEPGTTVPGSIASAIASTPSPGAAATRIVEQLRSDHPSARVRLLAGGAPPE